MEYTYITNAVFALLRSSLAFMFTYFTLHKFIVQKERTFQTSGFGGNGQSSVAGM
jgi:hypothetical protein